MNSDQRLLELAFTQSGNTVSTAAPDRGYDAPPGDYMLFVIDGDGVPSAARFVHIGPPRPSIWTTVFSSDGSFPEPRHETAMTAIGGKLYLFGGRGLKPTQEYDPVARDLDLPRAPTVRDPPLPAHRVRRQGVRRRRVHRRVIRTSRTSRAFGSSTRTRTRGARVRRFPAGRERGGAGAVLYDDKFYLVCGNNQGHNGGARPWFDVFDPATQTWSQLPDAPRGRDHFLAAVVGNRLVLAGGRQTTQPNPFTGTIPEVGRVRFRRRHVVDPRR